MQMPQANQRSSFSEEIERLHSLMLSGVLTEDEFRAAKTRILHNNY